MLIMVIIRGYPIYKLLSRTNMRAFSGCPHGAARNRLHVGTRPGNFQAWGATGFAIVVESTGFQNSDNSKPNCQASTWNISENISKTYPETHWNQTYPKCQYIHLLMVLKPLVALSFWGACPGTARFCTCKWKHFSVVIDCNWYWSIMVSYDLSFIMVNCDENHR